LTGSRDIDALQVQRGCRQQPGVDRTRNADLQAADSAGLGLKLAAVLVPVDKMRTDQRRHQRQDECDRNAEQRCLHAVSNRDSSRYPSSLTSDTFEPGAPSISKYSTMQDYRPFRAGSSVAARRSHPSIGNAVTSSARLRRIMSRIGGVQIRYSGSRSFWIHDSAGSSAADRAHGVGRLSAVSASR
jgi:hypothetical protein